MKKVSHLEKMPWEFKNQMIKANVVMRSHGTNPLSIHIPWTRLTDFFKDGHVQAIKYHPWSSQPDVICVTSSVLPSMRKDRVYCVTVAIKESTCRAYCTCPAGLSGCCKHVTSTLYCLEDFVRRSLREEEKNGLHRKAAEVEPA